MDQAPSTESVGAQQRQQARAYMRALLIGAAIGIPVAICAVLFTSAVHELENLLWRDLPDALGWHEPAWWYVLILPTLAGVLVAGALLLPGRGGHSPLEGLSMQAGPAIGVISVLAAALVSLSFGVVLGPEAPLVALGLAMGTIAGRVFRLDGDAAGLMPLAGAFAAIATLFGGPIVSSLMLFEVAAVSGAIEARRLPLALLPGFVAGGVGALVFTGIGQIPGIDQLSLSVPGLEPYGSVQLSDIGWGLLIALVTSLLIVGARRIALKINGLKAPQLALLVVGGLVVGVLAVVFREITDGSVDLVLFSGQSAIPQLLTETSAGLLIALVIAKMLGYAVSLAVGFRGGPIFPAVFLGVTAGMLSSVVLPGSHETAAVVAGIAAGTAAALGLPFTGALMATLLAGSAGANAVPIAILAAVIGWMANLVLVKRREQGAPAAPAAEAANRPSGQPAPAAARGSAPGAQ